MSQELPDLTLSEWRSTRDTLHRLARITGKVRGRYMPGSRHWWHTTLSVSARGLTTTPFPVAGQHLELTLDLSAHRLLAESSDGWFAGLPLQGQSPAGVSRQLNQELAAAGIVLEPELLSAFDDEADMPYDIAAASHFRQAINWVASVFGEFKGGLRQETSPVQLFPHHMDLALSWFSGRQVPGTDPADEENADEQMTFGFVTGDSAVPDAYFYTTAYPMPDCWTDLVLPDGAYWHTGGWIGTVLPYAAVVANASPDEVLMDYLKRLQDHGASLMS